MIQASILWRRLDTAGHDACRLERSARGWKLAGTAVFREKAQPAQIHYELQCDSRWRSQRGRIQGSVGKRAFAFEIARTSAGGWTLDGKRLRGLDAYVDLDLGFTPATNYTQLRRVALKLGESADVTVAWFDWSEKKLVVLPQRYQRRSKTTYWYESPTADYEGLLELEPNGFIKTYPRLWQSEG